MSDLDDFDLDDVKPERLGWCETHGVWWDIDQTADRCPHLGCDAKVTFYVPESRFEGTDQGSVEDAIDAARAAVESASRGHALQDYLIARIAEQTAHAVLRTIGGG
jgi:hypothetical protein